MSKSILEHFTNNKIFLSSILVLMLAVYIFSGMFSGLNYLNIIIGVSTHPSFIFIIVYPIFLFLASSIYKYFNIETIIIRFSKRNKYVKKLVVETVKSTTVLYICLIIILLIGANITKNTGFVIENYIYTTNIVWLIIYLIKLYLMIIFLTLSSILSYIYFKNKNIANLINFILIIYLYLSKYLFGINAYLNYLVPETHLNDPNGIIKKLDISIISSTLFYAFFISMVIYLLKKAIEKKEFFDEID